MIADCGVIHLGDNPSRHKPIVLKLNVGNIPVKSKEEVTRCKKPAWYKATQENKDQFTSDLDRMSCLLQPDTLHCLDSNCSDATHSRERDRVQSHFPNQKPRALPKTHHSTKNPTIYKNPPIYPKPTTQPKTQDFKSLNFA